MTKLPIPAASLLAAVAMGLSLGDTESAGEARPAAGAGDPARGALVWVTNGCGACHAFARAGSLGAKGSTAPSLDRYLVPDARRVKLPVELFAFSRVFWGGRGMPAYGAALGAQELEDLVSFLVGRPVSAPPAEVARVAPLPVPPPVVTASPAIVARWVKLERLPRRAAQGAALFARVGCLSCHTYLGSGSRRFRAPDLGSIGLGGRRALSWSQYVARPYDEGNNLMPAYADLGEDALGTIAAFLVASRGRR